MTGIILCAGYGSRLGNITKDTPKCLIDISGKCSLGRMLKNFKYSGINKIIIISGYWSSTIESYILSEEFADLDINVIYNANWENTNNAYSLRMAVCYQDLIKELIDYPNKNAMGIVRKKELNEEDMKVQLDGGKVAKVSKELPINQSFGEFTGIFKMSRKLTPFFKDDLDIVLSKNPNAWFEHALVGLCEQKSMWAKDVSHYPYIEIDFPEDLAEAIDRFPYDQPVWEQGGRHQSLKENKRNINDALALMVDFRNVLDKFGIRYWLNWGLLLGCVREGHPLQQDTDIDICIDKASERLLWEKVVPEMRKLRCFVPMWEYHYDNDCFIIRDGERIECNTMEKIQDHYVYSPERCKLKCPAIHLDKLEILEVMGESFNIPSNAEGMLTGWYNDWKTPSNTKPSSF